MFDVGFSELVVIGIVALVVIGPERLPKVARTAGHLFGRFQRYVSNVKADIQREMDAAELGKLKSEFQDAARTVEQTLGEQVRSIEADAQDLQKSLEHAAAETTGGINPPGEGVATEPASAQPESGEAKQLDLALGEPAIAAGAAPGIDKKG